MARAEGALVEDVDGNVLIDLSGGLACLPVGHRHPGVMAALGDAMASLSHAACAVLPHAPYADVAAALCRWAPGNWAKKAALFTSGAEAVENAVKLARRFTGRRAVLAATGGFHGRTFMAMALTGKIAAARRGFGPLPGEVFRIPYPDPYRLPPAEADALACRAVQAVRDAFTHTVDPEDVAAVVVEPVQGDAGVIVPPERYLRDLQALCREYGILLIADEVQTGCGRTGRFFASEHSGIAPDLICVGKGLGGGLPLSGVVGRAEILDAPDPGGIGGTHAGNWLACAAALATLGALEDERLIERAVAIEAVAAGRLRERLADCPLVGEIRARGAIIGRPSRHLLRLPLHQGHVQEDGSVAHHELGERPAVHGGVGFPVDLPDRLRSGQAHDAAQRHPVGARNPLLQDCCHALRIHVGSVGPDQAVKGDAVPRQAQGQLAAVDLVVEEQFVVGGRQDRKSVGVQDIVEDLAPVLQVGFRAAEKLHPICRTGGVHGCLPPGIPGLIQFTPGAGRTRIFRRKGHAGS